jgi:hypothetical protein
MMKQLLENSELFTTLSLLPKHFNEPIQYPKILTGVRRRYFPLVRWG